MLLTPEIVPGLVAGGASARSEAQAAPRFKARGHTRLPVYLRGKLGVVEHDHGVFVFPDTHAHQLGEKPQHCYTVRFTAQEVWGPEASPRDTLRVDTFDDYMDPA